MAIGRWGDRSEGHSTEASSSDARYTLAVARTAREEGALVVTRARAEALLEEGGRVAGARVRDALSGDQLEVRARVVIDGHRR